MNRIDYTNLGGFPLTEDALDFMQQSYSQVLSGLAAAVGNKVIVSGCEITGTNISAGWIYKPPVRCGSES